ncbi:MAG: hypothetical protein AB1782_17415 [Cyanobacteriota bacterium]
MFPEQLIIEQPFASKLFISAINKNRLAQAYMFTKGQPIVQYHFSMELAKILNCNNKINNLPCNTCTDCKWISSNTHPAVMTISPVDFVPQRGDLGDEGSDGSARTAKAKRSKNSIKVDQARLLRKNLSGSSKYHKVIIFTGAIDEKLPPEEHESLWLDYKDRVKPPESVNGRNNWVASYLNYYSFPAETANLLLKTVEEPFGRVLFIFITKDTDDMISTIVSRCQVVPLLRRKELIIEPVEYLQEIASLLPPKNPLDSIDVAKKLLDFSKTEQISIEKVLEYIELIYRKQLANSIDDLYFSRKIIEQINKIETSKKMIKSYVNQQAVLISMLNSLI